MTDSVHFHTDFYRRDALERAAAQHLGWAHIELGEAGAYIVARVEALAAMAEEERQALCDELCNQALSATVKSLRNGAPSDSGTPDHRLPTTPPWELLAPFTAGTTLGLGWTLDSLSPIRSGAAVLVLRHAQHGVARVAIRRNSGAPMGVAHTDQIDFLLMNGGGGSGQTEGTIARIMIALATVLRKKQKPFDADVLAALLPHTEARSAQGRNEPPRGPQVFKRVAPQIDVQQRTVALEFDESAIGRLALYDALLTFADRSYVFLTRPAPNRVGVQLRAKGQASTDDVRTLARDATNALNQLMRGSGGAAATPPTGLPPLPRRGVDIEALLAELEAGDPATLGLGFQPERGPGHEGLRVLNVRGTGACNSECVFCIEKFNPSHRPMPKTDATRELILSSSGNFDMLFFAMGEPTIHPKLFEHVELAKSVGFSAFGMSSHFRTFSDPRFALKVLQAGFEYFDIALHAADLDSQLEVNPIGDDGQSLFEALKGLAVLFRLADALGIRISVTQKIVISRLNVLQLEPIFRATYERGVRHFIFQPVRSMGLAPELQAKLAISEEEILPHLNELLRRTEGLGAVVKPYGFSRQDLLSADHVEAEQNRVKNIYGKGRRSEEQPDGRQGAIADNSAQWPLLSTAEKQRPTDGRHWVEVRKEGVGRLTFASDGTRPLLDAGLQLGMDLMFGCRMGSCGMCCAHLLEGRVDQSTQIFLNDEQIQAGFVLLCQARPLSDVVLRVCTDDEVDQL